MNVNIQAFTDGKGPNTEEQRVVEITKLSIGFSSLVCFPDWPFHGELRAHFEPSGFTSGSWNVEGFGFILSDKLWLKEFKAGLRAAGFSIKAVQNVRYGPKELQGNDYVALDIGQPFYTSWSRLQKEQEQKAVNDTFLVNS